MIQSVFYQILEYVVAPVFLMMMIFFVKGEESTSLFITRMYDNAIESLFIASYSYFLYFFSLTAHDVHGKAEVDRFGQQACLLGGAIGIIILLAYRDRYKELEKEAKRKLARKINGITVLMMCVLTYIIICCNWHSHHMHWTGRLDDFLVGLKDLAAFIVIPINLICLIVVIGVWVGLLMRGPREMNKQARSFIGRNKANVSDNDVEGFKQIATNHITPVPIRISSCVKVAEWFMRKEEYYNALEYINKAKVLAIGAVFPEHQLVGIRFIKVRLHCLLHQDEFVEAEISELKHSEKLASSNNKPFFPLWIRKLEQASNCHATKSA